MDEFARKYAELLGVNVEAHLFDGGTSYVLTYPGSALRTTYLWDEDRRRSDRRIMKFLHTIPWPDADDPREPERSTGS